MIDFYLDEMDLTASRPKSEQCRWNCDGSLWMWTYEKIKPLLPSSVKFGETFVRAGDTSLVVVASRLSED